MNNEEILNPFDGAEVDCVVWPFYRYTALIPQQLGGDLFEWLFLSLIVFNNEGKALPKDNYDDAAKLDVQKILVDKFGNILDGQTLERVISNAENDFVENIAGHGHAKRLKPETFSFLDTYENLFSDKLDVKYIYQDAITGEVLPFFDDTSFLEDSQNKNDAISIREEVKEPSKSAVKKAYEQYIKIKKFNLVPDEVEVELSDEFFDKDEQTFLEDSPFEQPEEEKKKELQSLNKYNIIFLKDKKVVFNLDVKIFVENNELVPKSPFGKNTNQWLGKCLKKGRHVSEALDCKIKELEKAYVVEQKKINSYIEAHKNDFASNLAALSTVYRMIDPLNDNRLREYVIKMDYAFAAQQKDRFFSDCGSFLEGLLTKIHYENMTPPLQRKQTTYEMFLRELDAKFRDSNVEYEKFFKKENLFFNWTKKYVKSNGEEFSYFKADLADILLRTNLINSPLMYPSFVGDIFELYELRNRFSHFNKRPENIHMDQETINKLTKCVKVLFEVI